MGYVQDYFTKKPRLHGVKHPKATDGDAVIQLYFFCAVSGIL